MHIILGGTGRVGSSVARALLQRGQKVTIVSRNADGASKLKQAGAEIAEVDIRDTTGLRDVFRNGRRAFILNPPADPASDTDAEERANVEAIVAALEDCGLEKIVAASTYGAHPGQRCGDLTVLHELETRLQAQPIPTAINRGAYYMSNWTGMLPMVHESGKLPSFFAGDLQLPMVAPEDLGEAAAVRLLSSHDDVGIRHVEGPERYTPRAVAEAMSEVLKQPVQLDVVPREAWEQTFLEFGFSEPAAASYACMTAAVADGKTSDAPDAMRGQTSLVDYISKHSAQ